MATEPKDLTNAALSPAHSAGRSGAPSAASPASLSAARLTVAARKARADAGSSASLLMAEPIAIIGMGCRFPGGADTPEKFWQLLAEGRSGIREMPESRWPGAATALPSALRKGGYLDEVDQFDPEFFGIAPREAPSVDPQQRLLLEVCWEALLDAHVPPSSLSGSATGVFVAVYNTDYFRMQMREGAAFDAYTGVGAAHSVAAGRLSFLLNLRGPCLAVDTACSSSLVAVQLACQSLRQRECSAALVGGSSLKLLPDEVRIFAEWGMLSSDGQAKTFDASADGFVPGEGCGVLVLKRLSDAIAAGDPIRAVIRGAAVNHDGRSSVLTAPNGPAQEDVLRAALRDAHLAASDVSFVETHGTGTSLGDPIEVEAVDAVYGRPSHTSANANAVCLLGAVKTNIGHLEASAGIAGLMKVVLSLEHQAIPPNLNFTRLNSQIRLGSGSRLQLAQEFHNWPRGASPRFAAVSSFGLGGTNAHVLLEEAPLLPRVADAERRNDASLAAILPISAHSFAGLRAIAATYVGLLRQPGVNFASIARAAARGRDHAAFRMAVVAGSPAEAADLLEAKLVQLRSAGDGLDVDAEAPGMHGKLGLLFSGQGSPWVGMLSALTDLPEAEKLLAFCEPLVQAQAGWSLRRAAETPAMLEDTAHAQPLLFVVQLALLRTLESWGIVADAVAGHSAGEIAAAVAAGALTVEQGLILAVKRGACMAVKPLGGEEPGGMLAAEMSLAEAEAALAFSLHPLAAPEIAAINAPRSLVFSGPASSVKQLSNQLAADQIRTRWLDVPYAFHSRAMETAAQSLRDALQTEYPSGLVARSSVKLVSTTTGQAWQAGDGDAAYWGRGVRQAVRFQQALEHLLSIGCRRFLELGPHPVLLRSATDTIVEAMAQSPAVDRPFTALATMRRGQSARTTLLSAAARLYELGADLRWDRLLPGPLGRVALPGYPWVRQRYWLAAPAAISSIPTAPRSNQTLLGQTVVSPFLEGRVSQISLDRGSFPWLTQHCWQQQPILPLAAWLEIARRAVCAFTGNEGAWLREFAIHKPLIFADQPVALQVLVSLGNEIKIAVDSEGSWQIFASGYWENSVPDLPTRQINLAHAMAETNEEVSPADIYQDLAASELTYGPAFRLLRSVHCGGQFALGEIIFPDDLRAAAEPGLPPTVLDACLQTMQATEPRESRHRAVLPVSVGSYRVTRVAGELVSLVRMKSSSATGAVADVTITDRQGAFVAEILDLRVRRVARAAKLSPCWTIGWHPVEEELRGANSCLSAAWTLLGDWDAAGVGSSLRAQVAQVFAQRDVSLLCTTEEDLNATPDQPLNLLLDGVDGRPGTILAELLRIVAIEQARPGSIRRFCLLTRGACAVVEGEETNAGQATWLGLARTFRLEHPSVPVLLLDLPLDDAAARQNAFEDELDPDGGGSLAGIEAGLVVDRLVSHAGGPSSGEYALRNGAWYRSQLKAWRPSTQPDSQSALQIESPGLLESLRMVPVVTPDPAPHEVQIACRAHGLNFRDVLTALGTYAGTSAPLGAECSGIVVKAGDTAGIAPGTAVFAFAPASLRSVVNVPAAFVAVKPATMSFAQAATLPVAFLTAHYAFSRLATLQPGQTVLIHSAAGGLGQAALQLAHRAGAWVIATAGHAAKRVYLRRQGIASVFDSRTAAFADRILEVTQGRGVDVVLNALSGDSLAASFRVLAPGGVFLEVGKRDIWTTEQAKTVRPDVRYTAFDLGEVATGNSSLIAEMLHELLPDFVSGKLAPLPHQAYAFPQAQAAFRHMASGRHVGKLVLLPPALSLPASSWSAALSQGTVLITGGTGALGVATARWLIEQGARSLILLSRSGVSAEATTLLAETASRKIAIVLEQADVANRTQLAEVLGRARHRDGAPLRVVIHAAGEANDCLLADQNRIDFQNAMRAKVEGARLLDELTAADDLLVTVYASSAAALLGSAGQGSYASANAFLDGFAQERSARGQFTVSVNWGAWDAQGMVARLTSAERSRMHRQGMRLMSPAPALAALREAIFSGLSRIAIADVSWEDYLAQLPAGSPVHHFFETFLPGGEKPTGSEDEVPSGTRVVDVHRQAQEEVAALLAAGRAERGPRMEALVRTSARKVLGLSPGRPMPADTALQEMGLDSLMALELRNVLAQAVGRPLSATLAFDQPTIRGLSQHLLSLLTLEKEKAVHRDPLPASFSGTNGRAGSPTAEDELASLSETDAEELLLAELDGKGRR